MAPPDSHWSQMDHTGIDDEQTAERYVLGLLSEEECFRFEEHFLDCPRCLESIEAVEGLRAGLTDVSAADAPAAAASNVAAFRSRTRPTRPFLTFLAAACVPLAILSGLFYAQTRGARHDLDDSRRLLEQSQRRQAELENALQRESAERGRVSVEGLSLRTAPVFLLNLTRGTSLAEPPNHVALPGAAGWVTLVFDRPDGRDASGFRVRVSTSDGQPIGEATAGTASGGLLSVSLPSERLPAGNYVLTVEALGGGQPLATYRFRAEAKR